MGAEYHGYVSDITCSVRNFVVFCVFLCSLFCCTCLTCHIMAKTVYYRPPIAVSALRHLLRRPASHLRRRAGGTERCLRSNGPRRCVDGVSQCGRGGDHQISSGSGRAAQRLGGGDRCRRCGRCLLPARLGSPHWLRHTRRGRVSCCCDCGQLSLIF